MGDFERIGKYYLLEKLSAGGMAEIFLAALPGAKNVHKFFAVKRVLPHYRDQQRLIKMFEREAKLASNLNQNNIVKMFEFGIHQGTPFLVMELLNGVTLSQLRKDLISRKQNLSYTQMAHILAEAANGLAYAHFTCTDATTGQPLNIIHRDISPQNIMVSYDGEVKIIDFGIAKPEFADNLTAVGTNIGKVSHMSPEQAQAGELDYRTDIFSLGIVAWEMIAREPLFSKKSYAETLARVMRCEIPPLEKYDKKVPPALSQMIMRMLQKNREDRYQTAEDLNRDLLRFISSTDPNFFAQDFRKFISGFYNVEKQEVAAKLRGYSQLPIFSVDVEHASAALSSYQDEKTIALKGDSLGTPPLAPSVGDKGSQTGSLKSLSHYRTNEELLYGEKPSSGFGLKMALGVVGVAFSFIAYHFIAADRPKPVDRKVAMTGPAQIKVESVPDGASIWLNGKFSGRVTPTTIDPAQTGGAIEMRKEGYRPHVVRINPSRAPQSVRGVLDKIDYGYLDIVVVPQTNIQIRLNNKPIQVSELPIYGLMIEANRTQTIEVSNQKNGKKATRLIFLEKEGFQELKLDLR